MENNRKDNIVRDAVTQAFVRRLTNQHFGGMGMRSEQEVQETIMDWFSECENDEEIIEMESMISDLTAQERENRIYDLRN